MKYVFKKPVYKTLIPLFDLLGSIIFFPIRLFKKPPSNPKNILVVRLDHIGDFVCTTPLFKNIRKKFPDAKITVLINSVSKDMAYRDPNIDKVITFSPFYLGCGDESPAYKGLMRVIKDIRNIGFDLGIEPRGDLLSILIMWLGGVKYRVGYGITGGGFLLNKEGKYDKSFHIIDRNLALLKDLNMPIETMSLSVYFNEKDKDDVERLLRRFTVYSQPPRNDMFVIIHPFAGARAKEWPRENFQKVIEYLKAKGNSIILVGSKDDEKSLFHGVVDLRGKLNLPQLGCLIGKVKFFLGLDSGPANIAAAVGAKTIVICSGTNMPQLWMPKGDNVRLLYKDTGCKPCELKICTRQGHKCMELIKVEDVVKIIGEAWQV